MSYNGTPISPTVRDATHYNMNHRKRGLALIFNHEFFKDNDYLSRIGTNIDCAALVSCLRELGFETRDYHNLNYDDVTNCLQAVSEIDHTDHDCLVVAILTHGNVGVLAAHDTTYSTDTVWSYFTADKCKTLAGKPKIFIIQACQGEKIDYGYSLRERTETDSSGLFRIPCLADFLIARASPPGHLAWRTENQGSWFISALCSELSRCAKEVDLLTLLTFVCQRVAIEYEIEDSEKPDAKGAKQIPCITSMLTRLVQF